ncbi:MAG TPA: RNA polymerase sigma factor [Pyrinomonadaceae bacterium]|nr:RNA polymerase sigma factor [Pyrinomonadaceae bacterium]
MTGPKQETRWVLRAQSGDREAFDSLLQAVQEPLYRYILRLTNERTLAEDILQEVFIRIYRKLGWLRDPDLFRPWAYRIASRETFKRLKRERHWAEQVRDESVLEAIPAEPSAEDFAPELIEHLPRLIARVSPASRAVLILHYLEEMPLSEVADVLGIAAGTAKSRLAYGLASLRGAIRDESPGAKESGPSIRS